MSQATTIKVDLELKHRLDNLKRYPRETYAEVIWRLTEMAVDTEPLSAETLGRIEEAIADFRAGRYVTEEEIDRDLGI
jgi:predicted transcriptional regulator